MNLFLHNSTENTFILILYLFIKKLILEINYVEDLEYNEDDPRREKNKKKGGKEFPRLLKFLATLSHQIFTSELPFQIESNEKINEKKFMTNI